MKNRGKNKKKQWKRILKNISSDLYDAARERDLTTAGFVVEKDKKNEVLKGDKEAAKGYSNIPTASSTIERKFYRRSKASIFAQCTDIWDENFETLQTASKTTEKARKASRPPEQQLDSTLIVPAGQSYNPTAVDHQILLMHVAKEEAKAEEAADPDVHKKRPKKKRPKLTQAQFDALRHEANLKTRKLTSKELAKKMHNDLENIPKLVKEIKKENRELDARKKRKEMRMAIKRYEKTNKFPMSFQLPGELAPNLRKLRADQNWVREVEFKRNKLPRARKTHVKNAVSKVYERRSRRNA
ncbi:hypothetical protein Aperf_G00000092863 [Anoplocephala perfoliata]